MMRSKRKALRQNQTNISMTILYFPTRIYALHVLIFIAILLGNTHALASANSNSIVRYLPGYEGPLPFHLETGYVGVGESENVQLFYYFVKSERSPEKDPVLIWLNGGPSCSALGGLVYEIGPLKFKKGQYNGGLPTLILNQYSWTKTSSVIFVDSPVGTGFSYPTEQSAAETGDFKQVQDLFQFLKKWLTDIHPEFLSNPFYVAGISYEGIIVPMLFEELAKGLEEGTMPLVNLKGYVLGNPVTTPSDFDYQIQYAHGMALISDELYQSLETSCGGKYFTEVDPNNVECTRNLQAYTKTLKGIQSASILEPVCSLYLHLPSITSRRWLNQDSNEALALGTHFPQSGCLGDELLLSRYWANDPNVRKSLHTREGSIKEWYLCKPGQLPYTYDVGKNSFEYHVRASAQGFRSLVFSGDRDLIVPFLATQAWIRALNYSIVDEWRPWILHDQVAGYTRSYSNKMTFATVKGAGHTAPQYYPKESFAMFQRWIDYESL